MVVQGRSSIQRRVCQYLVDMPANRDRVLQVGIYCCVEGSKFIIVQLFYWELKYVGVPVPVFFFGCHPSLLLRNGASVTVE